MKIRVYILATGLVLVSLAVGSSYAQQKTDANDTSLGDIARQLKAQKAKEPKAVKVFTNDNLPSVEEKAGFDATSPEKKPPKATPQESETPGQAHDKAYFQSRMSTLQSNLDIHKRELDVLQQKLGQNQMQYYPNPQDSMMQQFTRDDINKLTADIDAKKQQVADDEKAMDDLREQLRREGGDPSWLP